MNIEKNERVRKAMNAYFELYDYPNPKVVAQKVGLNYYRMNTFLNDKSNYADKSLNEIIKYLHRVSDRSTKLEEIINNLQ